MSPNNAKKLHSKLWIARLTVDSVWRRTPQTNDLLDVLKTINEVMEALSAELAKDPKTGQNTPPS